VARNDAEPLVDAVIEPTLTVVEVFDVVAWPDRPGVYDYPWVYGPNPATGWFCIIRPSAVHNGRPPGDDTALSFAG
jgi:hypothetical protein